MTISTSTLAPDTFTLHHFLCEKEPHLPDQLPGEHTEHKPSDAIRLFFPNWRNSVQTAPLQMIGHALYSTNFNTLQPHLQTQCNG